MTDKPLVSPAVPSQERVDKIAMVREDMEVFDSTGKHIGKVDGIYGGTSEHTTTVATVVPVPAAVANPQPAPMVAAIQKPVTHVPEFDDVMEPDEEFPQEMRERLRHDGFIRIDAGFLRHHRYALRDQLGRVETDRVLLNAPYDELFKH